ncbi:MAG: hypothetical protein QXE82_02230 [Candidatus Nitrosotenuis sp.]
MIPLESGEKVRKAFEVKSGPHGKGILYITTFGIAFEAQKYGLVLDVSFEWLQSYCVKKGKLQVVWDTPHGRRSYLFDVDSAEEACSVYFSANTNYAHSISELDALRLKLEKSSHRPDDQKPTWERVQGLSHC